MSENLVTIKTHLPYLRPGIMTCLLGDIQFDENGEVELAKEDADKLRGHFNFLKFSDEVEDLEVSEEIVEEKEKDVVVETDTMPVDFEPLEEVENEELESEEEVEENSESINEEEISDTEEPTEENEAIEEVDSSELKEELTSLKLSDLKDLCKEADIPSKDYVKLKKGDLVDFIIENKVFKIKVPTVTYSIKSSKNDKLVVSASELESRYFFGIPIKDQSGNVLESSQIEFFIRSATEEMEGYLNLKLSKQIIEESFDYYREDYRYWGYIPVSYPCIRPFKLIGLLGDIEQIEFPVDWLSVKRTNDGIGYARDIKLVPTAGQTINQSTVFSGITPNVGWWGQTSIPNYWTAIYCSSLERLPEDILDVIGKLASINVFAMLGDIILGAGIASQSIGIDGLSQSIATTSSATNSGYGARITGYLADLKLALPRLKAKYDGFELSAV